MSTNLLSGLTTALTAPSKISLKFQRFIAEHSINNEALIFDANFLPSSNVIYFSEFSTRKSDFEPTNIILAFGKKWRISGTHLTGIFSNESRLSIE